MLWNTIAINEKSEDVDTYEEVPTDSDEYLTDEDVKFIAQSSLGANNQVIAYQTKIFSKVKMGGLGVHNCDLNVTFKKSEEADQEMYSYVLKAIAPQCESQVSASPEDKFFYKERDFYRYVVPELLKSSTNNSFVARCYLVKDNALVMENLANRNFYVHNVFSDGILLKSALSSLAKLHAASILAENRLGKSFVEIYSDTFEEWLFTKTGKMFEWFESSINLLVTIAKSLELDDQHVPAICNKIFELLSPSKTWTNVVCHGDVKPSNLMFDDAQPIPNCILVDFQVVRYAPAMVDVAQLIYINCSRELRKHIETDLLKDYYTIFSNILQEQNLKERIASFSDIMQQYQELQLIGLIINALYFPMQHIIATNCTEPTNDLDGFHKCSLENRHELVLKMMEQDVIFKNRLKEIILEINEVADAIL